MFTELVTKTKACENRISKVESLFDELVLLFVMNVRDETILSHASNKEAFLSNQFSYRSKCYCFEIMNK